MLAHGRMPNLVLFFRCRRFIAGHTGNFPVTDRANRNGAK
jgi:hypothetical protein